METRSTKRNISVLQGNPFAILRDYDGHLHPPVKRKKKKKIKIKQTAHAPTSQPKTELFQQEEGKRNHKQDQKNTPSTSRQPFQHSHNGSSLFYSPQKALLALIGSGQFINQVTALTQQGLDVIYHPDATGPAGNQCGQFEIWCKNWFAEVKNSTNGALLQTISGTIDASIVTKDGSASTEDTLVNCALRELGPALNAAFQVAQQGINAGCSIADSTYEGVKLSINVVETISQSVCQTLQAQIARFEKNTCETAFESLKNWGPLIGGIVGGVAGAAILFCIYNQRESISNKLSGCCDSFTDRLRNICSCFSNCCTIRANNNSGV